MAIVSSSLNYKSRGITYSALSLPVSGSTILYGGQLVGFKTSDGNLVPASDTATFELAGVCAETVDNSAGANGDKYARVFKEGEFLLKTVGPVTASHYVYVSTDEKVAVSGSNATTGVYMGIATQNESSNKWWVQLGYRKTGYSSAN